MGKDVGKQLIFILNQIQNNRTWKLALSLMIDFYRYSLSPLIAILIALDELLQNLDAPPIVCTLKSTGP